MYDKYVKVNRRPSESCDDIEKYLRDDATTSNDFVKGLVEQLSHIEL